MNSKFFVTLSVFLIKHRANIKAVNKKGATPLILALKRGHTEIIKTLLEHLAAQSSCTEYKEYIDSTINRVMSIINGPAQQELDKETIEFSKRSIVSIRDNSPTTFLNNVQVDNHNSCISYS